MLKKYTKEEVIYFKESDWVFRRSSGYAGYDHKNNIPTSTYHINNYDESKWIYESEYSERKNLKHQYDVEFNIIFAFMNQNNKIKKCEEDSIFDFLDKKYFK